MSLWQSMKQGPSFIYLKHSFHCMVLSELFHHSQSKWMLASKILMKHIMLQNIFIYNTMVCKHTLINVLVGLQTEVKKNGTRIVNQ
jgi:hypothetical protein